MSDVIQLLPDHVANQIAAGEVVQRPASVVKELLENAIDAQSTKISLLIKDAGKTLIQVSDNGIGMSTTDARLSFERHATSKIKKAEDLFKLRTKGFRGEALASIAAVSHIELKSKQEGEETGTQITLKGSEVVSQEPCVTQRGSVVSVKNLFYNIPARRNFLKSKAVETRHIIDEFQRVALAHPQVAFSLHHNGSSIFELLKSNRRQRIVAIFGGKTNEKLVPVEEETEIIKITGFVGKPEFAQRTKGKQFFFVNNRFIKSGYLHHAVTSAFEGLLGNKKYPAYFLFFEVDPHSIDINIHPTKTEIKFEDEKALYAILRSTIKHALGQFNIAPSLDFKRNSNLDTPYGYKDKNPDQPHIEVDRDFNPFRNEQETPSRNKSSFRIKQRQSDWEGLYSGLNSDDMEDSLSVKFESEAVTGELFPTEEDNIPSGIFQVQKKYIVGALKEGMLIIDQHRAHYRILYEEFLKNITVKSSLSQQLLFPLILHFSNREIEMLIEIKDSLEQTGFDFSEINDEEVKINGIPNMVSESEVGTILDEVFAKLEQEVPDNEFKNTNRLAQTLAKSTAIKRGVSLSYKEQTSLINRLFACKEATVTPTEENIFIRLSADDLDKKFI